MQTARCAALENSELVTQSRDLGLHRRAGPKRRADQGNKCDENRTHLESDDNLSIVVTYFLSIRTKFSVCTTAHFHWAKSGEYITQVTAIGPLGLEYLDPKDDPRNG